MANDKDDNQDKGTEGQEDKQTVTAEQFAELQLKNEETLKLVESLKKSQSGSDATVTKLQKLLEQKDKERENEKKTADQINADKLQEITNRLNDAETAKMYALNKGLATQMLIDADLRVPRTLDRLIGKDEEETKAIITAYIEDRQDDHATEKDLEAKKYGRQIVDTTQKSIEKMSYADMANLPQAKFDAIPKDIVVKAMNAALKKQE